MRSSQGLVVLLEGDHQGTMPVNESILYQGPRERCELETPNFHATLCSGRLFLAKDEPDQPMAHSAISHWEDQLTRNCHPQLNSIPMSLIAATQ
jgi:hypothetical protein